MTILLLWLSTSAGLIGRLCLVLGPLMLVESLWGRGRVTLRSQLRSVGVWLTYLCVAGLVTSGFALLRKVFDPAPLLAISAGAHPSVWVQFIADAAVTMAALMIGDFFFYWMHRFEHRFLWPLHSLHHSVTEVSAMNSFHHWTESLIQMVCITVPVTFLIRIDQPQHTFLVAAYLAAHGAYLHSNMRLHFGPLGYVFGDNRFHRIHHSAEARHLDKNFGAATPLWDVIFGTALFARAGEWPDTGTPGTGEPMNLRDYALWPWVRSGRQAVGEDAGGAVQP